MDKILIIEDDADIAQLIQDYFEMQQFQVTVVTDGRAGLARALSEPFDIILLDIMLPGMDGFEICKALRKQTNIPILFVSARDSDIDVVRGLGLGADDYIRKPFIPSELVARATANLKRFRQFTAPVKNASSICFGDFEVDCDARRVTKGGLDVTMANKEFELLTFFLQNPNKVFSRESLFARIWDASTFGDITTVTVHIKRLREKIETDPNHPAWLETVWGAGYRFNL